MVLHLGILKKILEKSDSVVVCKSNKEKTFYFLRVFINNKAKNIEKTETKTIKGRTTIIPISSQTASRQLHRSMRKLNNKDKKCKNIKLLHTFGTIFVASFCWKSSSFHDICYTYQRIFSSCKSFIVKKICTFTLDVNKEEKKSHKWVFS